MTDAAERVRRFYLDMVAREQRAAKAPAEAVDRVDALLDVQEKARHDRDDGSVALTLTACHKLTDFKLRVDAESGELLSWYFQFLAVEGDRSMDHADALTMASRVAQPPPDARLEQAGYETLGGRTFFRARWYHEHQGVPVDGDFIEVLLNGKARLPFALTRRWHTPQLAPGPKP